MHLDYWIGSTSPPPYPNVGWRQWVIWLTVVVNGVLKSDFFFYYFAVDLSLLVIFYSL